MCVSEEEGKIVTKTGAVSLETSTFEFRSEFLDLSFIYYPEFSTSPSFSLSLK